MKKHLQKIKYSILLGAMLFGIKQVNHAQTFTVTNTFMSYTVPPLVTVINVTVAGGRGGGNGGNGAVYTSTMPVTPGQVLQVFCGVQGATGANAGGGGGGGGNAGGNYGNEGAGGGFSHIAVSPYNALDRHIVAGGGGGGGGWAGGQGGHGGLPGLTGGAGQGSAGTGGSLGGGGGAGGSNGGCGSGTTGSFFQGGHGASCSYGGGGGGGGYYGGGGGGGDNDPCCADGAGGGGGGSYCLYAGANCVTGGNAGPGYVIICDNLPAPTPTNNTSVGNQTVCAGKSASLSASGSGVISWFSTSTGGSSLGSGNTFVTSNLSAGTYTFYAENTTCIASNARAAVTLTVIANPTITASSGAICNGQSFTIVPSGANTYTFQGGGAVKTPTTTTSYTVQGTSTVGCLSNIAISNVTVNIIPTVAVNSGTICSGNPFTITPSGASTYTISGGASVVSPLTNTLYNVTGTSAQGCVSSNTAISNVAVNITPTVTVNSGSICTGNSFTIVPAGANSYTIQGGSSVVNPLSNISYTVKGTSTAGCVSANTATSIVTVNITPTVSVNSGTICTGNSFTIVPSGASTYTISGGASIVSPLTNTLYNITGTSAQGCVGSNTAISNVAVNITPTVAVNSGTICSGNSFTIVPSGANTYTISGGASIVSPLTNTLYNVTGTSAQGCVSANTATSNLTVNTTPTVTVNSGSICTGNSFTIVPSGASTYTISGGASVVSPLTNTLYNITGTSAQGCVGSNTAISNVAVNVTPTVTVNSGTICSGNSFTIVPSGASTYTISGGANVVSPLTSNVYNVTGTSAQGCVSSNTAISNVAVNTTPTIIVNSGAICSGDSFTIFPSGASTYTISGGVSVVSPMTNTLYNITGTSAQGCVSSNTAVSNVTVNITPTITVNSGTICSGNSFTLVPSGANTYTFNSGNAVVSPSTTSSYSVTGTSAEGCVSSNTAVSNVMVNVLPIVNSTASNATICVGETSTLSASGASTYVWNTTSTLVTLVVSPTITTSYTVAGTDNNGCVNTSAITQNVSACTGIDKVAEALEATISIYPNPNNGEFTILSSSDSRLSIINELGQIVKTVSLNANNEHKVLINEMANGIYFVVGQSNNQVIKQKMIVNK